MLQTWKRYFMLRSQKCGICHQQGLFWHERLKRFCVHCPDVYVHLQCIKTQIKESGNNYRCFRCNQPYIPSTQPVSWTVPLYEVLLAWIRNYFVCFCHAVFQSFLCTSFSAAHKCLPWTWLDIALFPGTFLGLLVILYLVNVALLVGIFQQNLEHVKNNTQLLSFLAGLTWVLTLVHFAPTTLLWSIVTVLGWNFWCLVGYQVYQDELVDRQIPRIWPLTD